jgi:hypothetical protein
MQDPKQHSKIFAELGFTYVDDGCEGECEVCEQKTDCTVYPELLKFPVSFFCREIFYLDKYRFIIYTIRKR